MIVDAARYARYWRDTLADAELGQGAFRQGDTDAFYTVSADALAQGRVDQAIVGSLFNTQADELKSLTVVLRPLVYKSRTSHARHNTGLPAVVTPIVTRATLMRDGRLTSLETTVVPRDLLEPLPRGEFSIGTIGSLDDFLTVRSHSRSRNEDEDAESKASEWDSYRGYCRDLIAAIFPELAQSTDFQKLEGGYLTLGAPGGASRAIGALYDQIGRDTPVAPLFDTFATQPTTEAIACLSDDAGFAARLGHASDRYALADGQRGALTHVLAADHGEVVAVNGPPGTGKTTLLLSVVASLWVKAALGGGEPPIVIAASANNQAVTNIIDAFGTDFASGDGPFAGRWLPRIASFGSYFPSASQRKNAAGYLTDAFFDAVEQPDYVDRAQAAYLGAAGAAFPDMTGASVADVLAALHERLSAQAAMLAEIEEAWNALVAARAVITAMLGDNPVEVLADRQREADEEAERLSYARSWRSTGIAIARANSCCRSCSAGCPRSPPAGLPPRARRCDRSGRAPCRLGPSFRTSIPPSPWKSKAPGRGMPMLRLRLPPQQLRRTPGTPPCFAGRPRSVPWASPPRKLGHSRSQRAIRAPIACCASQCL